MGRLDEKCSLLIKRCRAGRLSLLFVVQQSCRPIGSLGCVGCCIALCLSSQHNAIGFPARCVSHRRLSLLSSLPVAFIIAACFVCYRCLSLFSSALVAFVIAACCVYHRSLSLLSLQSVLFVAVSFCGVSCSCFLVDFYPCPLVCVGMLSRRCLLSVRLAAS